MPKMRGWIGDAADVVRHAGHGAGHVGHRRVGAFVGRRSSCSRAASSARWRARRTGRARRSCRSSAASVIVRWPARRRRVHQAQRPGVASCRWCAHRPSAQPPPKCRAPAVVERQVVVGGEPTRSGRAHRACESPFRPVLTLNLRPGPAGTMITGKSSSRFGVVVGAVEAERRGGRWVRHCSDSLDARAGGFAAVDQAADAVDERSHLDVLPVDLVGDQVEQHAVVVEPATSGRARSWSASTNRPAGGRPAATTFGPPGW